MWTVEYLWHDASVIGGVRWLPIGRFAVESEAERVAAYCARGYPSRVIRITTTGGEPMP